MVAESNRQLQLAAEARYAMRGEESMDGELQQPPRMESDAESSVESVSSDEDEAPSAKQRRKAACVTDDDTTSEKLDKKIRYVLANIQHKQLQRTTRKLQDRSINVLIMPKHMA